MGREISQNNWPREYNVWVVGGILTAQANHGRLQNADRPEGGRPVFPSPVIVVWDFPGKELAACAFTVYVYSLTMHGYRLHLPGIDGFTIVSAALPTYLASDIVPIKDQED